MVETTTTRIADRYVVHSSLGEGGMGTVHLVQDAQSGEYAALKLLKLEGHGEADILRFKQEFRAMTRLRHPNICEVRDYGTEPSGTPFFTMEVVPGKGLDELGRAELTAEAIMPIIAQVGAALSYLHARGYVHGDLKPDNLRIKPDGTVKLMDFGLMRPAGQRAEGIAGTLAYVSPEVTRGDRVDQRSDMYALGAVLYELLTGVQPIRGATPLEVLRGHLETTPAPSHALNPSIPEKLDRAVMRLLAKDPGARFSSAAELLAALGLASDEADGGRLLLAPFVGRSAEFEPLGEAIKALAASRQGGFQAIDGAPGVGKSRMLDEARITAQLAGLPFAMATATANGAAYAPIVSVARALLPQAQRHPEELARLAPILGRLLPELLPEGAPRGDDEGQAGVSAALVKLITLAAGNGGAVVALDGWDHADPSSKEALDHLVRAATSRQMPVLVLVAGREVDTGAHPVQRMSLAGLLSDEIATMVAGMLGHDLAATSRLAEQLLGLTGGVPRAIEDLLAHAVDQGAIARDQGRWRVPDTLPPEALSADARRQLSGRLDRLDDQARDAARAAALLEEPFALGLWAAAAGTDDATLFDAVDALTRAGLVESRGAGYGFATDDVRAFLAAEQTPEVAAKQHLAAADFLEKQGALDLAGRNALAGHLLASGIAERAVPAAMDAVRANLALLASDRVLTFAKGALALCDRLPADSATAAVRGDLLVSLGRAHNQRQEVDEANRCFDEALAIAEAQGDKARQGQSLVGLALLAMVRGDGSGRSARSIEIGGRAVNLAREAGDDATLARAATNRGRALVLSGQKEEGRANLEEALTVARRAGLALYEGRAQASLGLAKTQDPPTRNAGIADLRDAIAVQEKGGDRYGAGFSLNLLVDVLLHAGRFAEAADAAERGAAIMADLDSREDLMIAHVNLGQACLELGDMERAEASAAAALRLAEAANHAVVRAVAQGMAGMVKAVQGEGAEAARLLLAADAAGSAIGIQAYVVPYVVEGLMLVGRTTTAHERLSEALFAMRGQDGDPYIALTMAVLQAEVQVARGMGGEAEAHALDEAINQAAKLGAESQLARALGLRAIYALGSGKQDEAQRHLDEARGLTRKLGLRTLGTLFAALAGEIALATNAPEAHVLYQSMQAQADDVGMPLARALALFGQARALPGATHAGSQVAEAQRAAKALANNLDEAARDEVYASPMIATLLERAPEAFASAADAEGARMFNEQFQRVSHDMSTLFTQYGALHREWVASNARLKRLNEVTTRMNESLHLEQALPAIVTMTLEITGAERGFVVLKSDSRYNDMVCRAALDKKGNQLEPTTFSLSICQRVIDAGKAIAILDASADVDFQAAKSVVAFDIRTVMGAPLVAKGVTLGVLYVDSTALVTTFTEADLELLRTLALHAAVAIENARLYDRLEGHAAELEEALEKYRRADHEANTDALTGLANRRCFVEKCNLEIGVARRYSRPFCVIMLDVDHFKKFNDTYGHALGDEVLKAVGATLPAHVRPEDLPARLGGEEFTVMCPDADPGEAVAVAERIRAAIAAIKLYDADGQPVRQLTVSLGVALLLPTDQNVGNMLERADMALYACKHGGRNQVQLWREDMTGMPH